MGPRPGRTSPGSCSPVGRERQDAGHAARSCFVWRRHLQRVTYLLAYGWAYCKRAEGLFVFQARIDALITWARSQIPGTRVLPGIKTTLNVEEEDPWH